MSSTYVYPREDYLDRRVASSPISSTMDYQPDSEDDSTRPMRLKVLYTFDDQNKTNCLARWPRVLNIRTARLDETTQIGVIELKTCIQAIVSASPELVAKLGQDYTVYAYDYSEYETPLVGQGMLSWVLASASSTPSAPAHQSRTVVTGRVCKNILGLFSNGVQETLEVKLRLVPVPTCLQSEYLESMRKYRELSRIIPEEFDAQTWTDFLKANPSILSAGGSGSQSPIQGFNQSNVGIEHVQRLLTDGYDSLDARNRPFHHRRDSYASSTGEADAYRGGSPTPSMQSVGTQPVPPPMSRSTSRLSSYESQSHTRRISMSASIDGNYVSNDERADEGPAKKRAKIVKADYPGKSTFGKKVDSLRVAASTAASVRVFQPTAIKPSGNPVNSLEGPPRVPTPIPQATNQRQRPLLPTTRSTLGRESLMIQETEYKSPYLPSEDSTQLLDSAMTSPLTAQLGSVENSPEEPGSSPPVVRDMSVAPSSPVLPVLPQHEDSGFMSEALDELFMDGCDDGERPIDADDIAIAAQYSMRPDLKVSQVPVQPVQPPIMAPSQWQLQQEAEAKAQELSRRNARRAIGLKRSQTWSGDPSSEPAQAPPSRPKAPRRDSEAPRSKSRTGWDKEKRKESMQKRLAKSVAAGEVPPFCENCGSIETPTWRKAFSRIHSGSAEKAVISDEEGGIIAVEILETNEDGSTKLFKILKKSLLPYDEGFSAILLCNPCGLWLASKKSMRPESKWTSNAKRKDNKDKSKRPSRSKKQKSAEEEQSDMLDIKSEAMNLASEASWAPIAAECAVGDSPDQDEPDLPPMRPRPSGMESEPNNVGKSDLTLDPNAVAALQRAIQSSPARFLGSKQSPIELDGCSPEPLRRTLFPSPKTKGPLGTTTNEQSSSSQESSKPAKEVPPDRIDGDEQADKENLPPRPTTPDAFDELLSELPPITPSRPREPTTPSTLADLFKTPTNSTINKHSLSTGDFFSSAAKAFLHQKTPSRSPSKTTPQHADMTPYSRQLNQMLSDLNGPDTPGRRYSEIGLLLPTTEGGTPSRVFRTSDFDFGDFQSSDAVMPSSPPSNWFSVYQDPSEGSQWVDLGLGSSPLKSLDGSPGGKDVAEADVGASEAEGEQRQEAPVQTAVAA